MSGRAEVLAPPAWAPHIDDVAASSTHLFWTERTESGSRLTSPSAFAAEQ